MDKGVFAELPLLLSFTQAARLLGIGRNESLHALINSGLLRPVTILGRLKIPRAQIEQLASTGDAPSTMHARRAPRVKKAVGSIRDIKIS